MHHLDEMAKTMADAPMQSEPRDDTMAEVLKSQLNEAADRATFHRIESERWERIGAAAGAALVALEARSPVASVTPEELVERSRPQQAAVPGNAIAY